MRHPWNIIKTWLETLGTCGNCYRSVRLSAQSITSISLTWVLITCTCTSSRVSSSSAHKHTPQPQYSSDLVNTKWTLLLVSPNWVFSVCYLPGITQLLLLLPVVFSAVSYPPSVVCAPGNPVLLAPSPFVPVEYKDSDYPITNPRKPSEVVLLTSCLLSQLQYLQTVK